MRYWLALIATLFMVGVASTSNAEVQLSVSINLGSQPVWGPVGYDYVQFYYLPDIDVYYSVPYHCFYYDQDGRWIRSAHLPPRYHDYDLFHSYKVVINERNPWRHDQTYREKYSSYRGHYDQQVIRDSRDPKYFVIKDHPEHKQWVQEQKQHKGNGGRGHGQGHGKHGD